MKFRFGPLFIRVQQESSHTTSFPGSTPLWLGALQPKNPEISVESQMDQTMIRLPPVVVLFFRFGTERRKFPYHLKAYSVSRLPSRG